MTIPIVTPRGTIESQELILPGEVRQVTFRFQDDLLFRGFITSNAGFSVVDAQSEGKPIWTQEIPADVDPDEDEWCMRGRRLKALQEVVFWIKNTGISPGRYIARLR